MLLKAFFVVADSWYEQNMAMYLKFAYPSEGERPAQTIRHCNSFLHRVCWFHSCLFCCSSELWWLDLSCCLLVGHSKRHLSMSAFMREGGKSSSWNEVCVLLSTRFPIIALVFSCAGYEPRVLLLCLDGALLSGCLFVAVVSKHP